jgi:hypothetical protein
MHRHQFYKQLTFYYRYLKNREFFFINFITNLFINKRKNVVYNFIKARSLSYEYMSDKVNNIQYLKCANYLNATENRFVNENYVVNFDIKLHRSIHFDSFYVKMNIVTNVYEKQKKLRFRNQCYFIDQKNSFVMSIKLNLSKY